MGKEGHVGDGNEGAEVSGAFGAAKRAADEAKETVEESRRRVKDAVEEIGGGPAKDVEHAEQQVTDLRTRLQHDLVTLRDRVPDKDDLVARGRSAGLAVAGGLAALTIGVLGLKRRGRRRSHERRLSEQARALAVELARIDRDEVEEDLTEEEAGGRGGRRALLALLAAGAGIAVWARMREDDTPIPDLEAGIRDEVATTSAVEGGMVDLGGAGKR